MRRSPRQRSLSAQPVRVAWVLAIVALAAPVGATTPTPTAGLGVCPGQHLGSELPLGVGGSTVGATSGFMGSCGSSGGPEATFLYTAPVTGLYSIDTFGSDFDTLLYVRNVQCNGAELACNDQAMGDTSQVLVPLTEGQQIVVFVDGFAGATGEFLLNIALAPEPPPTPTPLPCPRQDIGSGLPLTVFGSTTQAPSLHAGSCSFDAGSPEESFLYTAPVTGVYEIVTESVSFFTLLYVRFGGCGGFEMACDTFGAPSGSRAVVPLTAGQPIAIFVDGFFEGMGPFALNIGLAASSTPTPSRTATRRRTPTPTVTSSRTQTATRTVTPTRTPTVPQALTGDCDGNGVVSIGEIQICVNLLLEVVGIEACPACDSDGDGEVAIGDIQRSVNCLVDAESIDCLGSPEPVDALCGDGVSEAAAGEQCDDGNNFGGDGCAANCTLEGDIALELGTFPAVSLSQATIQTISFPIILPLTGRVVVTTGMPRTQKSIGADGASDFEPGELPLALVVDKNQQDGFAFIEPIAIPGVACACVRGIPPSTCGGRPPALGGASSGGGTLCHDSPFACTDDPDGQCLPVFGADVYAAGKVGCEGTLADLDYVVIADSFTGEVTYNPSGGSVEEGAGIVNFSAIGTILGSCDFDPGNPDKGPDGVPCTDDDPASTRGIPIGIQQTTGTAEAMVLNANGAFGSHIQSGRMCGALPCATSFSGVLVSCEALLAGETSGICLASAFAALAQPTLGDIVVPTRFCGL